MQLIEAGNLPNARHAPRGPEIHHHYLAAEGRRIQRAAFQSGRMRQDFGWCGTGGWSGTGLCGDRTRTRRRTLAQERQVLRRILGGPGERGDHFLIGIQNRVKRNGHRLEPGQLHLLVGLGLRIGAIGIQLHQHEILHGERDFRPREHVGLHPVTVGAGIAREIHQHQFAFTARTVQRLAILILHPRERALRAPAQSA